MRRNLRFRRVRRREPSSRTWYWRNGRAATIVPRRSHCQLGFCTSTGWPTLRGGRSAVRAHRRSWSFVERRHRAFSRHAATSCQVGRRSAKVHRGGASTLPGRKSRSWRPRRSSAGDMPMALSGVLRCCSRARVSLMPSGRPSGPTLSLIMRFADLTATSARQFACGKATEVRRCVIPCWRKKSFIVSDTNCGPPSLVKVSGTPKSRQSEVSTCTRLRSWPCQIWNQLLKRSTMTP